MSTVREALPADVPVISALVRELAAYERESDQAKATDADFLEAIFGTDPVASCLLAEDDDGDVVGLALWFRSFSTWTGRPGMYLEDLYVRESARGAGHGKALIQALAAICVQRSYSRLEWAVLDWNAPSIAFYRALGALPMDEWTTFRLTGEALQTVASQVG